MTSRFERLERARQVIRRDGPREAARRIVKLAGQRLGVSDLEFPLDARYVVDSTSFQLPGPAPVVPRSRPLKIAWVTTPPAIGSGGHTTTLRMVQALEAAGHTCVLVLYDRFGGDAERHAALIRQGWPGVKAEVHGIEEGLHDADVAIATSWQTSHVLASIAKDPIHYFYLVQDFEAWFYPRGAMYALAEESYQFGFTSITVGPYLAEVLRIELGVDAIPTRFGCDTDVYRLTNRGARSGVVFYSKPEVPRRGYTLGMLALAEFHRLHPEQPIHFFGQAPSDVGFPHVRHDLMTPAALSDLYNETITGLALSFTNISLIPDEMLAAGNVPVLNASGPAQAVLTNPNVVWARPSPVALATALSEVVSAQDHRGRALRAAESVDRRGWNDIQGVVVAAIEERAYG